MNSVTPSTPPLIPGAQDLLQAIREHESQLIALRRDLHAHPELGFQVDRTADVVARFLQDCGVEVHRGLAGTGVVGTLQGLCGPGRSVGLRADMDALALSEQTGLEYQSTNPGRMHACGHDGHVAMLLGAAQYLSAHRDFQGTVQFIFQPAEEGQGGGRKMIEEGLFERFPVQAVYGMHNWPGIPAGKFGLRVGPIMASSDTWTATFRGTGGHGGAGAHLATDPTVVLGQFLLQVQCIVGRNVPAVEPAVLSVGCVRAGTPEAPNVIPSEVLVKGTSRCFTPEVRDVLERRLGEVAEALAAASHCTATLDYLRRYPPLVNAAAQTAMAAEAAASLVGQENVDRNLTPVTGSEDFSFMLNQKPGAFIFIGNGVEADGSCHYVHSPRYNFNDGILCLGAAYWCTLALAELRQSPS